MNKSSNLSILRYLNSRENLKIKLVSLYWECCGQYIIFQVYFQDFYFNLPSNDFFRTDYLFIYQQLNSEMIVNFRNIFIFPSSFRHNNYFHNITFSDIWGGNFFSFMNIKIIRSEFKFDFKFFF